MNPNEALFRAAQDLSVEYSKHLKALEEENELLKAALHLMMGGLDEYWTQQNPQAIEQANAALKGEHK